MKLNPSSLENKTLPYSSQAASFIKPNLLKGHLIMNSKGDLDSTTLLNFLLEKVKAPFHHLDRTNPKLIQFKTLEYLESKKNLTQTSEERNFAQALALKAGKTAFQIFNSPAFQKGNASREFFRTNRSTLLPYHKVSPLIKAENASATIVANKQPVQKKAASLPDSRSEIPSAKSHTAATAHRKDHPVLAKAKLAATKPALRTNPPPLTEKSLSNHASLIGAASVGILSGLGVAYSRSHAPFKGEIFGNQPLNQQSIDERRLNGQPLPSVEPKNFAREQELPPLMGTFPTPTQVPVPTEPEFLSLDQDLIDTQPAPSSTNLSSTPLGNQRLLETSSSALNYAIPVGVALLGILAVRRWLRNKGASKSTTSLQGTGNNNTKTSFSKPRKPNTHNNKTIVPSVPVNKTPVNSNSNGNNTNNIEDEHPEDLSFSKKVQKIENFQREHSSPQDIQNPPQNTSGFNNETPINSQETQENRIIKDNEHESNPKKEIIEEIIEGAKNANSGVEENKEEDNIQSLVQDDSSTTDEDTDLDNASQTVLDKIDTPESLPENLETSAEITSSPNTEKKLSDIEETYSKIKFDSLYKNKKSDKIKSEQDNNAYNNSIRDLIEIRDQIKLLITQCKDTSIQLLFQSEKLFKKLVNDKAIVLKEPSNRKQKFEEAAQNLIEEIKYGIFLLKKSSDELVKLTETNEKLIEKTKKSKFSFLKFFKKDKKEEVPAIQNNNNNNINHDNQTTSSRKSSSAIVLKKDDE